MLKTRLTLVAVCGLVIWLLFQLPKSVVENESELPAADADSIPAHIDDHTKAPEALRAMIRETRALFKAGLRNQKNAIFADSLANLYRAANQFDSAAWFAEEASRFFNTSESWKRAGDQYYQAYTLAIDATKQAGYAAKAQEYYGKVLKAEPDNHEVKTNLAMTYLTSENPMQGIALLREVLRADPKNEAALFNMGMLSVQSGQYERAVERLEELIGVNPDHIQGRLLLGLAYMNSGNTAGARKEFEKVKQMDKDPAVQATVDSYLKELK